MSDAHEYHHFINLTFIRLTCGADMNKTSQVFDTLMTAAEEDFTSRKISDPAMMREHDQPGLLLCLFLG